MKIVPAGRWLLTKDMMMSWAKSDDSIGQIRGELLNIIAMVRYESDFESLSDTKRANVLKIHRILKSVGHKIAANPSIPVESR